MPISLILAKRSRSDLSARIPVAQRIKRSLIPRLSMSSQIAYTRSFSNVKQSSSITNCLIPRLYQYSISSTTFSALLTRNFFAIRLLGQKIHRYGHPRLVINGISLIYLFRSNCPYLGKETLSRSVISFGSVPENTVPLSQYNKPGILLGEIFPLQSSTITCSPS